MSFEEKYAKYYDLFDQGKDYTKGCDFIEDTNYGNKQACKNLKLRKEKQK